jgi:hypothetical protein
MFESFGIVTATHALEMSVLEPGSFLLSCSDALVSTGRSYVLPPERERLAARSILVSSLHFDRQIGRVTRASESLGEKALACRDDNGQ